MDYMSIFDFDITYVKGELNKVADSLSRYFKSNIHADTHDIHEYVQADARWWSLSLSDREITQNKLDNSIIFANREKGVPIRIFPTAFLSYKNS